MTDLSARRAAWTGVALHPEGVDRNDILSRARLQLLRVALHPEGVDRNTKTPLLSKICPEVALHPEGVDRNALVGEGGVQCYGSPSTRKAWIEIHVGVSPSAVITGRPPPGGRG